jgi:hypothetical protein
MHPTAFVECPHNRHYPTGFMTAAAYTDAASSCGAGIKD